MRTIAVRCPEWRDWFEEVINRMYAVIETGGKQYRVQEGDVIDVEKLGAEAGEEVVFDKVLVLSDDEGLKVGKPYVDGAKITAKVVENGKGQKVIIFKYKSKKDYRKKQGHRQPYTRVEIESLNGVSSPKSEAKASEAKTEEPAKEESAPSTEGKVSASMKKDELIAYAKEHGIEIDEKATKAVIIDTINNAE
jgi:large subunit ribosomal protein L21